MKSKKMASAIACQIKLAGLSAGVCFGFAMQANAFVSSGLSEGSIAWSYQDVAQGKTGLDISYPMCVPEERQNTPEATAFAEEMSLVANLWNDHAIEAIGSEWPVKTIRFHTNISNEDCQRKRFKHESGVDVRPVQVNLRDGGGFSAGSHNLSLNYAMFDDIERHRSTSQHEYGHVLGLADDYKGSSIQGGRPPAMMKMHILLQEEDKFALRQMWENRGNYRDAECPSTHFFIDESYRGIYWAAGSKSCLPYLKSNIENNVNLNQFNVKNYDDCIVFLKDDNADLANFGGNTGQQERHREQNPEEYFIGEAVYAPICLDRENGADFLQPLAVHLNVDKMNKADSLWVGNNVHANIRMLQKQDNGRFLTLKDSHYYYPFAWFDNQWFGYDQEMGKEVALDIDAISLSIVDKKKEMIANNMAGLDLARSAQLNILDWPNANAIDQLKKSQMGGSCSELDIRTSGTYTISRDAFSDQTVYCEIDDANNKWTYIGYASDTSTLRPFFHYNRGVVQVDNPSHKNAAWLEDEKKSQYILDGARTRTYHPNTTGSYSNGLPSKMADDEMLIKVNDFDNGPKIYVRYDKDTPFFNDKYHRICMDDNKYDIKLKVDWPDSEWRNWNNKAQWPDNTYHDAEIHCSDSYALNEKVSFSYKDKTLGENGEVLSIRLNLAWGLKLLNSEWADAHPPVNPLEEWRVAKRNHQAWYFVRNSMPMATPSAMPLPMPTSTPDPDDSDNPEVGAGSSSWFILFLLAACGLRRKAN